MRRIGRTRPTTLLRRRQLELMFGVTAVALILAVRLVLIQVVHASQFQRDANNIHIHDIVLPARRGDIIDRNGAVLAMDVPRYEVVAAPRYVTQGPHGRADAYREGRILSRYLPFSARVLGRVLDHKTWYALLDRSVPNTVANRIQKLALTGVSVVPVSGREYPDGTLASQVVGMVGSGDQGLTGIEYEENRILAGHPGSWVVNTDPAGNPIPEWQIAYRPPRPGRTVELSIDANIEAVAQKWLKWGVKRAHADRGTVIIMNPHTGGILALANYPNFNPNQPYQVTNSQLTDMAVQYSIPPGSIFKPVTAAAALSSGVVTPNTLFDTKGYFYVDGLRIDDWKPGGWGWITFTKGLEYSSDQVFGETALRVGVRRFYRMVKAFGFFHPSGVGLPGDSPAIWLPESKVNPVDLATMGFGQGFSATPMQVLAADAAVVNGGTMMKPHIVRAILSPAGTLLHRTSRTAEGHPMSSTVAAEIEHMMVLEAAYGTGVPAEVPGYIIGGKTGTAQQIVNGQTSNSDFAASYLGFGPYPHVRFIMLVMIDHPHGSLFYGDQVSAPVWKHIAEFLFRYWGIKPYATGRNGTDPAPAAH